MIFVIFFYNDLDCRSNILKILSFKGNVYNDESGARENGSKSTKNPIKLSYLPQDQKETLAESPMLKNNHATPASNMQQETTVGSQAIQQLFKSWLTLLRTPSYSFSQS